MAANREQLEQLVAAAPNFRSRWDGFLKECEGEEVPPWFIGMSELAHYVVESYANRISEALQLFCTRVEIFFFKCMFSAIRN
jgi:hypothetical protein